MKESSIQRLDIGWRFLILWILANAVANILGLVVYQKIGQGEANPIWGFTLNLLLGAALGIFQWLVLRRWLFRSGWWILATAIGSAVGYFLQSVTFESIQDRGVWGLGVLITASAAALGAVVGIAQSIVLWKKVSNAGWWVIVSIISTVISQNIAQVIYPSFGDWGYTVVISLSEGVITGMGLIWILRSPITQETARPLSRLNLGIVGAIAGTFCGVVVTLFTFENNATDILQAYLFPCLAVSPSFIGGALGGIIGGIAETRLRSNLGLTGAIIGGAVIGIISVLAIKL